MQTMQSDSLSLPARDLLAILDGRRAVVVAQCVGSNVAMTAAAMAPDLVAARTVEGIPVWDTLYVRGFEVVAQDQPFMRIERLPSPASKTSKSDRYRSRQSGSNSDSSASGSA